MIHSVTESLKIYAIAEPEPKSFTITGKLTNLTADKDIVKGVPVTENEHFEFTLKPATNYRLPGGYHGDSIYDSVHVRQDDR